MDNVVVIGYGVVGKATADVFGIKYHYDIDPDRCNVNLQQAAQCRFVFICMPTPVDKEGNYQLDDIKKTIRAITDFHGGNIFIIRSTVFPGFARGLQRDLGVEGVISNPEFLSEATATEDTKNPPFIIIGGEESVYRDEVKAFYEARIKSAPIIITDNTTAEMAKLAMNAYFATKIIFANQLADGCRLLGANYETVKTILEKHPYGPNNHFQIWYKGKRGVNGSCLPKDALAYANYTTSPLAEIINQLNQDYTFRKDGE